MIAKLFYGGFVAGVVAAWLYLFWAYGPSWMLRTLIDGLRWM